MRRYHLLTAVLLTAMLALCAIACACAAEIRPIPVNHDSLDLANGEYGFRVTNANRIEDGGYFIAALYLQDRYDGEQILAMAPGDRVWVNDEAWTVTEVVLHPDGDDPHAACVREIYTEEENYGYIVFEPQEDGTYKAVEDDWVPVTPVGSVKVQLPFPDTFEFIRVSAGEEQAPEDARAFLDWLAEYGQEDFTAYHSTCTLKDGALVRVFHSSYPEGPEEDAEAPEDAESESETEGEEGAEEEPEPEPEPGYLTPYQYRYALEFSEGTAAVTAAEPIPTYYYVDADGKPLFPYREWSTLDKVYNVYGNEDHSFVNNSGIDRSVLYFIREDGEPLFPAGRMFKNDQDRKVFGSAQLPYSFGVESLGSFYFDHGLVRVRWQVIDFWRYFQRRNYTGSQIKVMEEYDALLREDGTMFEIPFGYKLEGYSEGRLLLSRDGFFGIFSVTGEWIAQPIYGGGKPYVEGLAQLMTPDGRWGMIDTEGNIVLPFTYDKISGVSSGLVSCYREENGWSILRIMQ